VLNHTENIRRSTVILKLVAYEPRHVGLPFSSAWKTLEEFTVLGAFDEAHHHPLGPVCGRVIDAFGHVHMQAVHRVHDLAQKSLMPPPWACVHNHVLETGSQ